MNEEESRPDNSKTIWNDPEQADIAEILYNGGLINWDYWASRKKITPRQGAILAHDIDPLKWSDGTFSEGQWHSKLNEEIQHLYEWLNDRADFYTLVELEKRLGDGYASYRMKEAAGRLSTGKNQDAEIASIYEKHEPKQRQQEKAILECLKENGYVPSSLPEREAGKSGAKSVVKKQLLENKALFSNKSFDLAWERLRANGSIADRG